MQPTGQHWWVSALALAPTHTALDAWLSNEPCAEGTTTPGSTPAPHLYASAAQQSSSGLTTSGLQATATSHRFKSALRWNLGVCHMLTPMCCHAWRLQATRPACWGSQHACTSSQQEAA